MNEEENPGRNQRPGPVWDEESPQSLRLGLKVTPGQGLSDQIAWIG